MQHWWCMKQIKMCCLGSMCISTFEIAGVCWSLEGHSPSWLAKLIHLSRPWAWGSHCGTEHTTWDCDSPQACCSMTSYCSSCFSTTMTSSMMSLTSVCCCCSTTSSTSCCLMKKTTTTTSCYSMTSYCTVPDEPQSPVQCLQISAHHNSWWPCCSWYHWCPVQVGVGALEIASECFPLLCPLTATDATLLPTGCAWSQDQEQNAGFSMAPNTLTTGVGLCPSVMALLPCSSTVQSRWDVWGEVPQRWQRERASCPSSSPAGFQRSTEQDGKPAVQPALRVAPCWIIQCWIRLPAFVRKQRQPPGQVDVDVLNSDLLTNCFGYGVPQDKFSQQMSRLAANIAKGLAACEVKHLAAISESSLEIPRLPGSSEFRCTTVPLSATE